MSIRRVYLAGPITGLSWAEANGWRQDVAKRLAPNIRAVSPLRGKEYLAGETTIADHYDRLLSTARAITSRDRFDCLRADMVLMNLLGATRVSIGSMIELGWADAARVPIVVVMGLGNPHEHAMVREIASWIVPTLKEAVEVVNAVLGEGVSIASDGLRLPGDVCYRLTEAGRAVLNERP